MNLKLIDYLFFCLDSHGEWVFLTISEFDWRVVSFILPRPSVAQHFLNTFFLFIFDIFLFTFRPPKYVYSIRFWALILSILKNVDPLIILTPSQVWVPEYCDPLIMLTCQTFYFHPPPPSFGQNILMHCIKNKKK